MNNILAVHINKLCCVCVVVKAHLLDIFPNTGFHTSSKHRKTWPFFIFFLFFSFPQKCKWFYNTGILLMLDSMVIVVVPAAFIRQHLGKESDSREQWWQWVCGESSDTHERVSEPRNLHSASTKRWFSRWVDSLPRKLIMWNSLVKSLS